jgi:pilus assembly protein Flp/PilA
MSLLHATLTYLLARCEFAAEDGQGMAEYGLILALVAVVCAAAFTVLQGGINNTLNTITNSL